MNTDQNNNSNQSGLPSRPEQLSQDTNPASQEPLGPVIYAYTRAQALSDGMQVDVTTTAQEAGFRTPVFLTWAVYDQFVSVPAGVEGQDEAGRLWDILWMLFNAIRRSCGNAGHLTFQLYVRNDNRRAKTGNAVGRMWPTRHRRRQPSHNRDVARRGLIPTAHGGLAKCGAAFLWPTGAHTPPRPQAFIY